MKVDARGVQRFIKYSFVGVSTFLVDLFFLYIFTHFVQLNVYGATTIAFLLAVSLNHYISSRHVFSQSLTPHTKSYIHFIGIALCALLATITSMYLLVSIIGVHYILARLVTAGAIGMASYLYNLYNNFNVAGKH
jgi:putative flippase GtrA